MRIRIFLAACAMALTAGCSSMPTSQTTKDLQDAPKYTQEEKDAMTEEEKVALYNESMTEDRNEVVCRRQHVVGSHFKKTVCKTRAEMAQEQESAQEALRRGGGYGCPSGGPTGGSTAGGGICN
jgi:hypothetical protein